MPHQDIDTTFGAVVQEQRLAAGLSLQTCAERLQAAGLSHFHRTTVDRVERGERALKLSEAVTIASVLDIDLTSTFIQVTPEAALEVVSVWLSVKNARAMIAGSNIDDIERTLESAEEYLAVLRETRSYPEATHRCEQVAVILADFVTSHRHVDETARGLLDALPHTSAL